MNLTLESLIIMVTEMRDAQKVYYHCRTSENQRYARYLEEKVDKAIIAWREKDKPEQARL